MHKICLLLGVLVLMSSCKEEVSDEIVCSVLNNAYGVLDEDVYQTYYYDQMQTGLSCEEFNQRQYYEDDFCLSASNAVADSAPAQNHSRETTYTNDYISGVLKGDTIAIDKHHVYSLVSRGFEFSSINKLDEKEYVPLDISGEKLFVSQDKVVIYGEGNLIISNIKGEILQKEIIGFNADITLKDNILYIATSQYHENLEDEELCQQIKYIGSQAYQSLLNISKIKLSEPANIERDYYYGAKFVHIDENHDYVVYNSYTHEGSTSAIADMDKNSFVVLEGRVLHTSHMKEYDDLLHVYNWNGWEGTRYSVLDRNLELISQSRGYAPGEMLKAAKFGRDYSYIMTFEMVDPLFVFSLEDKAKPVLTGELKFPGEPEYLDQLDSGHLVSLGLGGNRELVLSLFDVSNPSLPLRIDTLELSSKADRVAYGPKNLLIYMNHMLVKTEYAYYLVHLKKDELKLERKIDIMGSPRTFFKNNKLFIKDGRDWKKINLNNSRDWEKIEIDG